MHEFPRHEVPSSATELLKKALKAHGAFKDVDHARPQLAMDERGWEANILKFIYRSLPYYAHVGREIEITRPGGFLKERPVGKPIPVDTEHLAELIAKTIDDAKLE
ncbi:hypothetical protein A2856_01770 [Candidatus Uhrbacteria bacterium RIFCSPHIGHO2_01_FULL_63_20]|uniref:Uncharacterized protein n=1 Tax=Candidatus Uhrbacteria bacterium RIFCSPHIGHO2_01_FULL_63_20 TaxID=1802385 RepID=A0A1F7TKB5_9BACT|nr:MAG: hypothetical protein A2856_01770 [Candidatus Uhrbacteria bacterium RIFCSPHIGHO2_01_FULL_63_20]